jgi:hypothetical protein
VTAAKGSHKTRGRVVHTIESLMARTTEVGDCQEWTGCYQNGVPFVTSSGKCWLVRRLILSLQGKELSTKQYAIAKCKNPACVSPDHIRVHAQRTHMQRIGGMPVKSPKQRSMKIAAYSREHRSHLTMDIARQIRLSDLSGPELAEQFNCCRGTISKIRRNESWKEHTGLFAGLGAQ